MVLAIVVMGQLGIENGQFVAMIGAGVFALAFAVEDLMSNMAAGVMIMSFSPYKQGDTVLIAEEEGVVSKIELFNTLLTTPQGALILVPNSEVVGANITNFNSNEYLRLDIDFAFEYSTTLKEARDLLMDVMDRHELVLAEPPAEVVVKELGEEHLLLTARPWVEPTTHIEAKYSLVEAIFDAFQEADIGISMPEDEEEEEEDEDEGPEDPDDIEEYSGTNFLVRRRTKADMAKGWMDGLDMMDDKEREESARGSLKSMRAILATPAILAKQPSKADLQRQRDDEKARVAAVSAGPQAKGEPFYFVHKEWLDSWKRFVAGGPDRPGKISNHVLLGQDGTPVRGLRLGVDYRTVSPALWNVLVGLYGGGPPIMKPTSSIY